MAFPFATITGLRQRILLAIGSTTFASAAAMACTTKHAETHDAGDPTSSAGRTQPAAGRGGSKSNPPENQECKGFPAQRECMSRAQMQQKATFGCGMIPISPTPTSEEVDDKFLANGCLRHAVACDSCCNPAIGPGEPQGDGSCCYTYCSGACCGRPFVVAGETRLADVEERSDWLQPRGVAEPSSLSERIAAEWLEDARMEHASIGSFARFTLDLLSFGAPAELVEQAQRAALDEVEHARLCFGLAARYGGIAFGPAQLSAAGAVAAESLWDAAVAAFDEGCIGETLAAMIAHAALEQAWEPEVRGALARIANDEARHAELAWRFVAWAAARLGPSLSRELERRLGQALSVPAPSADRESEDVRAELHAAGRLTAADKIAVSYSGLRDVIAPCLAALVPPPLATEAPYLA